VLHCVCEAMKSSPTTQHCVHCYYHLQLSLIHCLLSATHPVCLLMLQSPHRSPWRWDALALQGRYRHLQLSEVPHTHTDHTHTHIGISLADLNWSSQKSPNVILRKTLDFSTEVTTFRWGRNSQPQCHTCLNHYRSTGLLITSDF